MLVADLKMLSIECMIQLRFAILEIISPSQTKILYETLQLTRSQLVHPMSSNTVSYCLEDKRNPQEWHWRLYFIYNYSFNVLVVFWCCWCTGSRKAHVHLVFWCCWTRGVQEGTCTLGVLVLLDNQDKYVGGPNAFKGTG